MIIAYENMIETADITASSEFGSYPFEAALRDTRLSRIGRTTACTSEYVMFDNLPGTVRMAVILAHNISASATVTLQASAMPDFSSTLYSAAMTRYGDTYYSLIDTDYLITFSGNITYEGSDITYGGEAITIDETFYPMWRILIEDPTVWTSLWGISFTNTELKELLKISHIPSFEYSS